MKKTLLFTYILVHSYTAFSAFGFNTIPEENALLTVTEEALNLSPTRYKVLLWNIYKQSKGSYEKELNKIVTTEKPQITMFQEVSFEENLEEKLPCLEQSDCYMSKAFQYGDKSFGVLTSSQFPILKAQPVHSDQNEPILITPKTSLITTIKIDETDVMIINTHGINFVTLMAYKSQLMEIVKIAKDFSGPIVWAGDFNSWNPGRINLLWDATQSLNLTELKIENSYLIKTFTGFQLDRVFSRGFSSIKGKATRSTGSDHNPILFDFTL